MFCFLDWRFQRRLWCTLAILAALISTVAGRTTEVTQDIDDQIEMLVRDLGSDHFARRRRAKEKLSQLGTRAFDALFIAQKNDDIEIRLQVQGLLRSIKVDWVKPSEPDNVRTTFRSYSSLSVPQRETRITTLGKLSDFGGLPFLCRVVRFETSEYVSKRAALIILELIEDSKQEELLTWEPTIRTELSASRRTGASWIQTFLDTIKDPSGSFAQWQGHVTREQQTFRAEPTRWQRSITRDFLKWQISHWDRLGKANEAIDLLQQSMPVLVTDLKELQESIDWLTDRKAWNVIQKLESEFQGMVEHDPFTNYLIADAFIQRQLNVKAQEYVERAIQIAARLEAHERVELADALVQQVFIDWATDVLRRVINESEPFTDEWTETTMALADVYFDWGKSKKTAQLLKAMVEKAAEDKFYRSRINAIHSRFAEAANYYSGLHYFALGLTQLQEHEIEAAKATLQKAWAIDDSNVDILIAMHRVQTDDATWKSQVENDLRQRTKEFHSKVLMAEQQHQTINSPLSARYVAFHCNQFAWLVGNTIGDYQLALERSLRSLEMLPGEASYKDTLARCYFSVRDLENAVMTQQEAARLEPHVGAIQRQLEEFEAALKKRQSEN